jgi:predicted nucleic acid-binding protein
VLKPYGNRPLTNAEAWAVYEGFMADDRIALRIDEPEELEPHWKTFGSRDTASPKRCMDAYLAAFAVAAGLRLVTTDTAFRDFPGLNLTLLK